MQKELRLLCVLVSLLAPVASLGSASGHADENAPGQADDSDTENARPLRVLAIEPPLQFDGDAYPSYELGMGYSFLSEGSDPFPFGWNAHYTKNVSPTMGFIGELGANYQSDEVVDLSIVTFGGGLRLNRRSGGSITPYVDAIVGLASTSLVPRARVESTVFESTVRRSSTDLTFLGGGGVDILLNERWALRTGVAYQRIFADQALNLFRIQAGIVYRGGQTIASRVTVAPPPLPREPLPKEPPPRALQPPRPPPPATPRPPPARTPAPSRPAPAPRPSSSFDRGGELMRSGDYADAAIAFIEHLRAEARDQFTVAIGLFCDRRNLDAQVVDSRNAPQLFLLHVPRQGLTCYGLYWGLYDSRQEAEAAIRLGATRSMEQVVLPVSRLIR
ncbi:MAG: hypothetical protein E2P02_02345 [Acidobacteria bacterium]|nr:MAG: hypothetical protein E2P02_02345 [Acidobacteriota bacterium]